MMLDQLIATPLCQWLRDCGLPLSEREIARWERTLPGPLPDDYRTFLKYFNGGDYYDPSSIGGFEFFSLNCADWAEWRDLQEQRETHEGRVPEGAIPIGQTGPLYLILIDFARNRELVRWERDAELTIDREENRIPLASSFLELARETTEVEPLKERRRYTLAEKEPFISIEAHDLDGLKKWVAKKGPLEKLPDGGIELLRAACNDGDFHGAVWLLEQGLDPTGPIVKGEKTPIELADASGCGDIVVLLLEHGSDPKHLHRGRKSRFKPQPSILAFVEQWQAGLRTSNRIADLMSSD
jgi:hypothetical protein